MAENERLQAERQGISDSANLELAMSRAKLCHQNSCPSVSLDEQLSEQTTSEVLRLQLENQRLLEQLQELRDSVGLSSATASRLVEVEKENRRLASKVDKLSSNSSHEMQKLVTPGVAG